ncbi:hypothetical protein SDC9_136770 [bioreactor metagenome]|uniref:Uncharacterized protein n=1 Tax=bioreactor metagenome TaxID=1076179 RepID=A0A645DKR8_9ZZZZ
MVGNDHLVHPQKLVSPHDGAAAHIQIGFFLHLARNALLRRFARFHEAGDQRKHLGRPHRVARQQHLPIHLDDGRQYWRRIVPVRPATGRATQAHLLASVFHEGHRLQGRRAVRTKAGIVVHGALLFWLAARIDHRSAWTNTRQAGNTPVDR